MNRDSTYRYQELGAETIDFGVLVAPETMLIKRTRHTDTQGRVRMILNLGRREIDVRFPSVYSRKTREYKFIIPIDEVFDLYQFQSENDTKTSFILTLRTPPHFYRKLSEGIADTHDDAAFTWREQDAWIRQTNILGNEFDVDQMKTRPVTLRNLPEGIVNIGRWTTYRITIDDTTIDKEKYRVFRAALRDYNVEIAKVPRFEFTHEWKSGWDLLEQSLLEYDSSSASVAAQNVCNHPLQDLFDSKKNDIYLPFSVRYQLEVCISNGWINEHNVTREFLERLSTTDTDRAKHILEAVALGRVRVFDAMNIFELRVPRLPSMRSRIPENCVLIRSVIVTPSAMILNTPYVEMTNRVIRRYKEHSDRFLRVRFEDDELRGYARIHATDQKTMDGVLSKVFRTLTTGIVIGDRHYDFLAFGNSQLREHGAYFFAALPSGPTASQIRAWMGRFEHERIVAKHAARIGQCFSTTRAIRTAGFPPVRKTDLIEDVERNGFNFTDGVGKISRFYAETIAKELGLRGDPPSVYQFRMAGCKGVLAIAPDLGATHVKLRNSQFKFETTYSGMEIIRWSEYWVATLNRQLIIVLSALGVSDEIFLLIQDKEIKLMERAMIDDGAALEALTAHVDPNRMTLTIAGLVEAGFRRSNDPFVTSLLRLWRAWSIKYLKEKAKLSVTEGACILGCTDETRTLRGHFDADRVDDDAGLETKIAKLPEVFVQITCPDSGHRKVIEGLCIIARNPSLHSGDIRVVKAVNVPALHHLVDVLVLPQTGDRDLSSMCSGGDLDGDDYVVIWDKRLLPEIWNAEPMDYNAPTPKPLDRDVTQTDITKFFVKYMKNDFLPTIAHAHLAWADFLEDGIRNEKCLKLAQLHSKAVDYPKTGQPAQMPKALKAKRWPHFMEKKGRNSYRSEKILGKLYDAVDRVAFVANYDASFDGRILNACEANEDIMQSARELKHEYDTSLQRIMAQHDIKTEFEVWSTFVLDHSKASKDYKFHEEIGQLSNSLKQQYYSAVIDKAGGKDWAHLVPWAVAMYRVTKEELESAKLRRDGNGMPFISFPWLLRSTLIQIVKGVDQLTRKGPNVNGDKFQGIIPEPSFNPETQMYDDPYRPQANGVGDERPHETVDQVVATGVDYAHPRDPSSTTLGFGVNGTSTTHSDAHHISNEGFPSGSYVPDLSIPPQPTGEQYAMIDKIINGSQASDASQKSMSDSRSVSETSSSKTSAAKRFSTTMAGKSLLDSAEPMAKGGFDMPSIVGIPRKTNSKPFGGLVVDALPNKELPNLMDNGLVDISDKASSTGSGLLIDVEHVDGAEAIDHSRKPSRSSFLSEELAGLRLGSVAPMERPSDKCENHATLSIAGSKDSRNPNSLPDDLEMQPERSLRGQKDSVQSISRTSLSEKYGGTLNSGGGGYGDKTNQFNDHTLMDDGVNGQAEDDDEDDDDDGEVVMVDPLANGGDNDVERLIKLGGM